MKFGKHIQSQQVPGWSRYYLDYKFLKKIISSLAANRPASEAAVLALDTQGPSSTLTDSPGRPPIFPSSGLDVDRGPDFQAHKAAFFFKLERELEKINTFYLQKEAELKLRLETLLSKRRAAAMRGLPDSADESTQLHVEWNAVEEGFRLLERDLGKLQQYVEINATGFRKILKKFDKHSKSSTKELYLARQVDVQPVFNRQLISELSDTVAACLLDLTDLSSGIQFEGSSVHDIFTQQIMMESMPQMGPFRDLESNLRRAVSTSDRPAITDCIRFADALAQQNEGKADVTRILWNVIIEAPPDMADLILISLSLPFDFQYVDDINGRTCLHEAAIVGALRLVNLCIDKGVQADKLDVYGRSALHYAAMNGHSHICLRLLEVNLPPDVLDMDNYSPIVYATLRGSVDCVRVLLEEGHVPVQPISGIGDLIPLSLASQSGHVDVVLLLLQHGAQCVPNSTGEYPMHLAARAGHLEVCKVLLHTEGWDTPDKYHEWTPMFHAARYGRGDCIQLLLKAGCRADIVDELGHLAVHYAAWYGHYDCVQALLDATPTVSPSNTMDTDSHKSPPLEARQPVSEIDLIPSLSLPPPIMPHRVYGHNYLDKTYLVQVTIGHSDHHSNSFVGVKIHHRLISPTFKDEYLLTSTPLKLVMTTDSDVGTAPYSVSLPQRDQPNVFLFQMTSLENLSLKFSIYPNFGTKTIGRAVALPSLFVGIHNNQRFTLPILDHRLHVIGEVPFEVKIITPFDMVTLEIGGDVETYWKSTSMTVPEVYQPVLSSLTHRAHLLGSAQASPSAHSISSTTSYGMTVSSLRGEYMYLVVQVTRDLHPVIYNHWLLSDTEYDIGVADVTLAQFEALAVKCGRHYGPELMSIDQNWLKPNAMVSLTQLMKHLPTNIGLSLELAYPTRRIKDRYALGRLIDLNVFVDSVLRTIYEVSTFPGGQHARRKVAFSSFSPDVCSALNWKQPNYPVFFATMYGKLVRHPPSPTALAVDDDEDLRLTSLGAAVEFARMNNLLGVMVNADLLVQVPSLIREIRDAGLLVGIFGALQQSSRQPGSDPPEIDGTPLDAYLREGIVIYYDYSTRSQEFML